MKTQTFFTLFVFLIVFTLTVVKSPAVEANGGTVIFFIHGLSGDMTTFGSMDSALMTDLPRVRPDLKPEASMDRLANAIPAYPTFDNSRNTYEFAFLTGQRLVQEGKMRPNPEFNVIVHSQGGIVFWIFYTLAKLKIKYEMEDGRVLDFAQFLPAVNKITKVVFLGSPIWGSKWGVLSNSWTLKRLTGIAGFSVGQISDMSHVSDTVYNFQTRAIQIDKSDLTDHLMTFQPLYVAGVLPSSMSAKAQRFDWIKRRVLEYLEGEVGLAKGYQLESDIAVSVYSARNQFFYAVDNGDQITAKDFRLLGDRSFHKTGIESGSPLGNLRLVESTHMTANSNDFYGIVNYPEWCLNLPEGKSCNHPTYPIILKFLSGCDVNSPLCDQKELAALAQEKGWKEKEHQPNHLTPNKMKTFALDLIIRLHDEQAEKKFTRLGGNLNFLESIFKFDETIVMANKDRPYRIFINQSGKSGNKMTKVGRDEKGSYLRVSFVGHVIPNNENYPKDKLEADFLKEFKKGFKVPFTIDLAEGEILHRTVEAVVRPTYLTVLEVSTAQNLK